MLLVGPSPIDILGNGRQGRDVGEPAASAHSEEQAKKLHLEAIPKLRRWDREERDRLGVPRLGDEGRKHGVEQREPERP